MNTKAFKIDSDEKLAAAELKMKEMKKNIQTKDAQIEELKRTITQITTENSDLQKKLVKAINKIKVVSFLGANQLEI